MDLILTTDAHAPSCDLIYRGCCLREDGLLHICCTKDWPSCKTGRREMTSVETVSFGRSDQADAIRSDRRADDACCVEVARVA